MNRFWDLLEQSVIVQGVLALLFSATIAYMYITGKPVPQELVALVSAIIGYFFGAKTMKAEERVARFMSNKH